MTMTAVSDETGREPSREAVAAMLARMLYNDATLDESTAEQRASWLAAADAIRKMYRRSSPVAQEPVAWQYRYKLPDQTWSTWQPIERSTFELLVPNEQMQSRCLYAASPPATSAGVGADEIARACDDLRGIGHCGESTSDKIARQRRDAVIDEVRAAILALLSRAGDRK